MTCSQCKFIRCLTSGEREMKQILSPVIPKFLIHISILHPHFNKRQSGDQVMAI